MITNQPFSECGVDGNSLEQPQLARAESSTVDAEHNKEEPSANTLLTGLRANGLSLKGLSAIVANAYTTSLAGVRRV